MFNRKIVYVRWLDHYSRNESTNFDQEVGPAVCQSVGFVVSENEGYIEIARDIVLDDEGEPEEKDAILAIVKSCILTQEEIK